MKNGVMRVSLLFTFFVLFVATLKGVTGDEYDHKVRETRNRLKTTRERGCARVLLLKQLSSSRCYSHHLFSKRGRETSFPRAMMMRSSESVWKRARFETQSLVVNFWFDLSRKACERGQRGQKWQRSATWILTSLSLFLSLLLKLNSL